MKTRYTKIKQAIGRLQSELFEMEREKKCRTAELEKYVRRHRSLSFEGLETADYDRLQKIYAYLDARFKIEWQGGLRCDKRGMRLYFWIDDDPEYLILHLTSTSENICFGGSTSWIVKAETLADKIKVLSQVKKDIAKIIK